MEKNDKIEWKKNETKNSTPLSHVKIEENPSSSPLDFLNKSRL